MRIRQKQASGLSLQKNSLVVPDGATEKLVNVLNQRDNLYIKERGFKELYESGTTIYGIFEYEEYIVIVTNSQLLRIDKFGNVQGSLTSSNEPFEIDGTLRPSPYSFSFAPFSRIINDQAFFCTPEGIRVMRTETSNSSELPGLDAPTIKGTADPTVIDQNFHKGQGIIERYFNPLLVEGIDLFDSGNAELKTFYTNDLILQIARQDSGNLENFDLEADQAISYKAVLRRELPNGQTIESPPSAPVFAYNPVMGPSLWLNADSSNEIYDEADNPLPVSSANRNTIFIRVYFASSGTVSSPNVNVGDKYTGVLSGCRSVTYDNTSFNFVGLNDENRMNGRHTFECIYAYAGGPIEFYWFRVELLNAPTQDLYDDGSADRSAGDCFFQFDRYSNFEIKVPDNAKTGDFVDLYYSQTEIPLSENPNAIPDGDYYFAKEIELTGSLNLSVTFDDGIFQRGIPLYTNPSDGDVTKRPNTVPPGANAIETWKGSTFYANTYKRHTVLLTHIGGQMGADRTLSIQFTDSGTPENFTFPQIQANSDAVTIKKRTMELASNVISSSSNFLCYFSGGNIEYPGGITIISRVPNRAFKVFVDNSDVLMEPPIGTSFAGTDIESRQEARRNRIYWSKQGQPEAVPFFTEVGSEDEDILNIHATRESLIVIKREGIFALYGNPSDGTLFVREIDTTVKGITATGVASLGNRVYTKTNQGIIAISETSVFLVGREQVEPLLKVSDESSTQNTVMYALEDDRQLYVASPINPSDSTRTVYSYNALTQTWSEISKVFTWGFVISNNFTASKTFQNNRVITDGTKVYIERKDYKLTDWADLEENNSVTAVSSDGLEVTLNSAFAGPVGSVLSWDVKLYKITDIDGTKVTLNVPFAGAVGDAVVLYTPIKSFIRTSPIDGGDSSYIKQFTFFTMNLRYDALSGCDLSYRSDWFGQGLITNWTKQTERRGWGKEPWGRFPWGQNTGRDLQYLTQPSQIIHSQVPLEQQKTTFLQAEVRHEIACEGMFIQQMAFEVETSSNKAAR